MNDSRTRNLALIVVAILGASVVGVASLRRGELESAATRSASPRSAAAGQSHGRGGGRGAGDESRLSLAERVARRRAERGATNALARRVEVVPIGPEAPGIDGRAVLEAARAIAPRVDACVGERGGREALLAAMQTPDGRILRHVALFDLGPEGRPIPSTLRVEPQLAPAMAECFTASLLDLEVPGVGADGARITVPLFALQRPGQRRGDGGVDPLR